MPPRRQPMLEWHQTAALPRVGPLVLAVANEKGGVGKTTLAAHLIAAMLEAGLGVGVIDIDARQKSTGQWWTNRALAGRRAGLPAVMLESIRPTYLPDRRQSETQDLELLLAAIRSQIEHGARVVVIDCPGADSFLAEVALTSADILVTPVGASPLDLDLLARFDAERREYREASVFTEAVAAARVRREDGFGAGSPIAPLRWFVAVNRLRPDENPATLRPVADLHALSGRLGFAVIPGLRERPVYRDLWREGLTVFDLNLRSTPDARPARGEVRALLRALNIPALARKL